MRKKMKIDLVMNIGKGYDPAPTIAHYTRIAYWGKGYVILEGEASCQGKTWRVRHRYFVPENLKKTPEALRKYFIYGIEETE